MDEQRLREELHAAHVPDAAGASLRARALVLAAHRARPARPARRRRSPRSGVGRLAVLAGLVLATTSVAAASDPGGVTNWMTTKLRITSPPARPPASLTDLPGGGRLLLAAGPDAWVLGRGSERRIPGVSGQIGWSAFGHYIARAHGSTLAATTLSGRVAWTQRYAAPVRDPRWSPDGNRIAFRVGPVLHVTAADGTLSHPVASAGAPAIRSRDVPVAWRPGTGHVLAVVDGPRSIALVDADSGVRLRQLRAPGGTFAVSWSADGTRLLVVGTHAARLSTADGRLVWQRTAAAGTRFVDGRLAPSGRQAAILRATRSGRADALLVAGAAAGTRRLASGRGLGDLAFSPDGRWLLVGWRRYDSWLFFATAPGDRRVRQVTGVSRRVGGRAATVEGWCCVTR